MTGNEVAAMLNVSRRTLYRWHHSGRLYGWQWTAAQIEAKRAQLQPRKRGPARNSQSKRYHEGRHSFDKERTR